jgi:hypothetical protein
METNTVAYKLLFTIENVLRELCIDQLTKIYGEKWYKSQLSPTAFQKFEDGLKYDRLYLSLSYISFHPVYYLDFSDLRETMIRKDNWRNAFEEIFGTKYRDLINSSLSQLEPIQNKIAHNRTVLGHEVVVLGKFSGDLENCLGQSRFSRCVENSKRYQQIFPRFGEVAAEVTSVCQRMLRYQKSPGPLLWDGYSKMWWWHKDYVGSKIEDIDNFYQLHTEYRELRRGRGAGPEIEAWVRSHAILEVANAATLASNILQKLGARERDQEP